MTTEYDNYITAVVSNTYVFSLHSLKVNDGVWIGAVSKEASVLMFWSH